MSKYAVLGEAYQTSVNGFAIVGVKGAEPDDGLAFFAYREDADAMVKMANEYLGMKQRIAELEEGQ